MRQLREKLRKEILAWERVDRFAFHTGPTEYADDPAPMRTRLKAREIVRRQSYGSKPRQPEDLFAPLAHSAATLFATADRTASASVPSVCCISMTSARRERDAGAACSYVGIG